VRLETFLPQRSGRAVGLVRTALDPIAQGREFLEVGNRIRRGPS